MQPPPIANDRPSVWGVLTSEWRAFRSEVYNVMAEDGQGRDETGRAHYGTPLQPHNGRDACADAYEEALDLCAYLMQRILEIRTEDPVQRRDDLVEELSVLRVVYKAAREMACDLRRLIVAKAGGRLDLPAPPQDLRMLVRKQGLKNIAEYLGISATTLKKYLTGDRSIPIEILHRLCNIEGFDLRATVQTLGSRRQVTKCTANPTS